MWLSLLNEVPTTCQVLSAVLQPELCICTAMFVSGRTVCHMIRLLFAFCVCLLQRELLCNNMQAV